MKEALEVVEGEVGESFLVMEGGEADELGLGEDLGDHVGSEGLGLLGEFGQFVEAAVFLFQQGLKGRDLRLETGDLGGCATPCRPDLAEGESGSRLWAQARGRERLLPLDRLGAGCPPKHGRTRNDGMRGVLGLVRGGGGSSADLQVCL